MYIENNNFLISIDEASGAISSFFVKSINCDIIGDKRLLANFRLCVPLDDYLCNYIDGMEQKPLSVTYGDKSVTVVFSNLFSEKGVYDIELSYTILLNDDHVVFKSKLTNNCDLKISEFWFPRIGGWTQFSVNRDAKLAMPGYLSCRHELSLFKQYPGYKDLGSETAEFSADYPGMMMPWWDIYDPETNYGLYLGYHDKTFRYSTWHTYLYPNSTGRSEDAWMNSEEACGEPVGLIYSHVRYPFISNGETYDTGEFIVRIHEGDWHYGSQFYRKWFMEYFPFDKSSSWLRKKSSWFSSIIYQPEDKIITDFDGYDKWCIDARESGISCFELLGWDKGGIERDYPVYTPEDKLGGKEGFRKLLKSINDRGDKSLVFVNYNIIDGASNWFKEELKEYMHMDTFGQTPNWMAWGESTLLARKNICSRRHLLSSVIPQMEEILERQFLEIVRDGADGLQIDKLCAGSTLDFNPLNVLKPDEAMCEGLVQAIGRLLEKCRTINPGFCIASEAVQDRLIPYIDVYYRNSINHNISPLRYVFPEWTSCQHISYPYEFNGVNGAVLTGSVIDVEPEMYSDTIKKPTWGKMASYIMEVERIRGELFDIIFLGDYYDDLYATINEMKENTAFKTEETAEKKPGSEVMIPGGNISAGSSNAGALHYSVHGSRETGRRAVVVINTSMNAKKYNWQFTHKEVRSALLYKPFESICTVGAGEFLEIKGEGLHILVECQLD